MTDSVKSYSMLATPVAGTTHTGLDQLVDGIVKDPGLAGSNIAGDIAAGAAAANTLNSLLVQAINATHVGGNGPTKVFTAADVVTIHNWIVANVKPQWDAAHGVGTATTETGFYLVQGDGGTTRYRGDGLVDSVENGLYHMGNAISGNTFLNQDGTAGVGTDKVAAWLTEFYTDHSTTQTGLDTLTDLMMGDRGLAKNNSDAKIAAGVDAANGILNLINDGIKALGLGADGRISEDDVRAIHDWIHNDPARYQQFVALHGDDENGVETGFHLIQGDGGTGVMFGENIVNTIGDGIFHIGFDYNSDGTRFVNEDGNDNQTVSDVADWLNYFYADQSTTGTGLDRIVDTIKSDRGLATWTDADQIVDGADAADGLNHLLVDAIHATNADADGWITVDDLYKMNAWVRADDDRYAHFLELHGDDEGGEETGFHNVQNDGGSTEYFGRNLINTVADGMYHIGFDIEDGRFLNEDGDANQTLEDVSAWLNYFYGGKTLVQGTDSGEKILGTAAQEELVGEGGNDSIDGGGGSDLIYGGWGDDSVTGGAGTDIIYGGTGRDKLDGGQDGDIYRVTGSEADGWSGFGDYDTYRDTGTQGVDVIEAVGPGDVDIGVTGFGPTSGIEKIDASGAGGAVRVLGDWNNNLLDFRGVTFVGNITIAAGYGNDTVYGTAGNDSIEAGGGDDKVYGGAGSDTHIVTGNEAGGWDSFSGYDTYSDTGPAGDVDRIVAIGDDQVDVGLTKFNALSGIEVVDGTGAWGGVRLLGDWNENVLDFRTTTFLGGNVSIDGGYGNDTITGSVGNDTITGGGGDDNLDGYKGSDTYVVTGNEAGGWDSFSGYDLYKDTGASTDTDTILAIGDDNVDIGLRSFGPETGIEVIDGSGATGTVRLLGDWNDNVLDFSTVTLVGGNIVIDGGYGNDTITGTADADTITGGGGDDDLDGADGSDTYIVSGNEPAGWDSFSGYDTYADTGTSGVDTIVAIGDGDVDIGVSAFGPETGIEVIDASQAVGKVRLLGDYNDNVLDFTGVTILGKATIDGGYGDDTITGTASGNAIIGGGGNDLLDGAGGSDYYYVTGNQAGGWSSFAGFDTYADSGASGIDTIRAYGKGPIDIGLAGFDSSSGIEVIDATGATGAVRLLGDWTDDTLDFTGVTLIGNIGIDGGGGADVIIGNEAANTITGGTGQDNLDGAGGGDTYVVTGNIAGGWSSFSDYDLYADSGASGIDTIAAVGKGNVDIGLDEFDQTSGIEVIDATLATGKVRLVGDWESDVFDFTGVTFKGKITVDAGGGDDTVIGTAGAETIAGGSGNDVLTGGAGNDAFLFNAKPDMWGNVDTITDFSVPGDTILIDHLAFTKIGKVGAFAAANLVIGTKALDAADRLIYDKTSGNLFYDADGSGKGAAILFAHLSPNLSLTASDFLIV